MGVGTTSAMPRAYLRSARWAPRAPPTPRHGRARAPQRSAILRACAPSRTGSPGRSPAARPSTPATASTGGPTTARGAAGRPTRRRRRGRPTCSRTCHSRWTWVGDVVHRTIAAVFTRLRDHRPSGQLDLDPDATPDPEREVEEVTRTMRREFRASKEGRYRADPKRIKGLVEHEYATPVADAEWKEMNRRAIEGVRGFLASKTFAELVDERPGHVVPVRAARLVRLRGDLGLGRARLRAADARRAPRSTTGRRARSAPRRTRSSCSATRCSSRARPGSPRERVKGRLVYVNTGTVHEVVPTESSLAAARRRMRDSIADMRRRLEIGGTAGAEQARVPHDRRPREVRRRARSAGSARADPRPPAPPPGSASGSGHSPSVCCTAMRQAASTSSRPSPVAARNAASVGRPRPLASRNASPSVGVLLEQQPEQRPRLQQHGTVELVERGPDEPAQRLVLPAQHEGEDVVRPVRRRARHRVGDLRRGLLLLHAPVLVRAEEAQHRVHGEPLVQPGLLGLDAEAGLHEQVDRVVQAGVRRRRRRRAARRSRSTDRGRRDGAAAAPRGCARTS